MSGLQYEPCNINNIFIPFQNSFDRKAAHHIYDEGAWGANHI